MRSILVLVLVASAAFAQNDSGSDPVKPLFHWTFDGGEPSLPPTLVTAAGPRPPQFPTFAAINTAAHFTGKGITIRESQLPNLQFTNGDAITLEAWVKVDSLNDGAYAYLVGKGRTKGNSKNQTFALRLHGAKGTSKISFLFASDVTGIAGPARADSTQMVGTMSP